MAIYKLQNGDWSKILDFVLLILNKDFSPINDKSFRYTKPVTFKYNSYIINLV